MELRKDYSPKQRKLILTAGPEGSGTSVEIPSTMTELPRGIFSCCSNLKEVILPDNIKKIEDEAFACCSNLKTIKMPCLTSIGERAFFYCKSLESINLQHGLEYISDVSFIGCYSLKEIEIPSSVKAIGDFAFTECENLQKATIKANCELNIHMFRYCDKLKTIKITQQSYDLSPDFVCMYKNKIEIIKSKTLDDLLAEGKSLKEISTIYKNNEER